MTLVYHWKPGTELIKYFLNFRPNSFNFIFGKLLAFISPVVQSYPLSLGCYVGVLETLLAFSNQGLILLGYVQSAHWGVQSSGCRGLTHNLPSQPL